MTNSHGTKGEWRYCSSEHLRDFSSRRSMRHSRWCVVLLLFCFPDASWSTMQDLLAEKLALYGLSLNTYGGIYKIGHPYSISHWKKLEVAFVYRRNKRNHRNQRGGGPIITRVAKECKISCAFVWKIEGALIFFERAIDPDIERAIGERTVGPGVFTIDDLDACLILILYEEEPCWGLENYQQHLLMMTESEVSKSTISQLKKKHPTSVLVSEDKHYSPW